MTKTIYFANAILLAAADGEGPGAVERLTGIAAIIIYVSLALIAFWGAFCIIVVWMRVSRQRFSDEATQNEFLTALDQPLVKGKFDEAMELCDGDERALPQLAAMAIENRRLGYARVRQMVLDHFQRDVLTDFEHRISWVNTVIKAAPMVGLLGTVIGMMGAFGNLASQQNVNADKLAEDIMLALITTASGLAIAIPLVIAVQSINVRIRKMEDVVESGLTRFLDSYRRSLRWSEDATAPPRVPEKAR